MSQALSLENYNNESTAVLLTADTGIVEDNNNAISFDNIINETKNVLNDCIDFANNTLITENSNSNSNSSNNNFPVNAFMEIINNNIKEIGIENSLNLTLGENVEDIISEQKDIVTNESEEVDNITEYPIELISETTDDMLDKSENIDETTDDTEINNIIDVSEKIINTDIEIDIKQNIDYANNSKIQVNFDKNLLNTETVTEIETTNFELEIKPADVNNTIGNISNRENLNNTQEENSSIEEILGEEKIRDLNIESIEAEVSENNNESMPRESAEEHGIKAVLNTETEQFELNTDNKTDSTKQTAPTAPTEIRNGKIIEQITKQLNRLSTQSKINMTLNPESLGKVSIQLTKTAEGMSAQFTVATQETQEILMKNIDGLREVLMSHGMNVDNLNVKLSDTQKSSYNSDWTEQGGSQGNNKNKERQNNKNKNSNLFEKMMADNLTQEEIEEKI